jgi:hypothetical protein
LLFVACVDNLGDDVVDRADRIEPFAHVEGPKVGAVGRDGRVR